MSNQTTTDAVWKATTKAQAFLYNKMSGALLIGLEPAGTTRVIVFWSSRNDPEHPALQDFLRAIQAGNTRTLDFLRMVRES